MGKRTFYKQGLGISAFVYVQVMRHSEAKGREGSGILGSTVILEQDKPGCTGQKRFLSL